ncbi:MAG: hypothetical protein B6I19_02265 [Bacteroidetes bacterium 4572_114]|nr:MAG: hypothetical protein B6I19_02265 [Bacteroidetes bacterium 4572_114]
MFRIIKTIHNIFDKKKKNETYDYIRGFGDCFELLKIGFEKTSHVSPGWENIRLKRILFEFLHFEFEVSQTQLQQIKDLFYFYDEEYIIIDKIFGQVIAKPQGESSHFIDDGFDIKLQNFMLKEILYKIINHKFNLSKAQVRFISKISGSNITHNEKTQKILHFLEGLDIENKWPDYHSIVSEKVELLRQNIELNHIYDDYKDLQKENATLMQKYRDRDKLSKENSFLHIVVDLFLNRRVYKFDKYELSEIYNRKYSSPLQRFRLMIEYLSKLKNSPAKQPFQLSQSEKIDIKNIICNNKKIGEGIQELYNYINFIIARDERKVFNCIRKKN